MTSIDQNTKGSNLNSTGNEAKVDCVEEQNVSYSSKEERKLLRRVDLHVLPWLCLTYGLSLIDRLNISAARIAGMEADLNLYGNRYSIVVLVFFITYVLAEIPSNAVIRRIGTQKYLTPMIAGWGAIAMCFGFVQTYEQTVALRILLGLFEGGFLPACVFVISCWYKRYEVQQRIAIWFVMGSVISGFTGIISYGLTQMEGLGGLRGWRWIFIVPGALTVALAVPIYFYIADFPEKARWLTPEQLAMMRERLADDRGEDLEEGELTGASRQGLIRAVTDWKVYIMALLLLFPTAGAYSFAFFIPTILGTFGFNVALSQILTTPPYILAAIVSIGTGILADRTRKRTPFIIGYSILVIVGLVMMGWGNNTGARLTGVFLAVTGNQCAIPSAIAFMTNNIVGSAKRQFAVPIQTIFGGIGGIIGAVMFHPRDHPTYRPGMYAAIGCMSLNIILSGGMALYFWRQNKDADENGKIIEGNPEFRYTI